MEFLSCANGILFPTASGEAPMWTVWTALDTRRSTTLPSMDTGRSEINKKKNTCCSVCASEKQGQPPPTSERLPWGETWLLIGRMWKHCVCVYVIVCFFIIGVDVYLNCLIGLVVCFSTQWCGGDAATERGLDQHRRQQRLLPAAPGRLEGRRAHRQTAHPPGAFAPQTQRAGLLPARLIMIFFFLALVRFQFALVRNGRELRATLST